jgi:hypothetical protein
VYYFFLAVVVVIRYETTATARWALLLIVRAFFNNTITIAIWAGFHLCASGGCYHTPTCILRWCFAESAGGTAYAKACGQSGRVSNFVQILLSNLRKQNGSKHQSPSAHGVSI